MTQPSPRPHGITVLWLKMLFLHWRPNNGMDVRRVFTDDIQLASVSSVHTGKTKISKVEYFLISSHLERVPSLIVSCWSLLTGTVICYHTTAGVNTSCFLFVYGDMQKLHTLSDCPCTPLTFLSQVWTIIHSNVKI